MTALLVAVGAGLGAASRFWVAHHLDGRTPWGTLLINVAGSFVLGVAVGAGASADAMALLGTGFCGGLTTYSAFAVQTRDQAADRGFPAGAAYAAATVVLAVVVCALGFVVAQA
jgi:CrcB protein